MTEEPLASLEPHALWEQFDTIRKIPRESKHESAVIDYIRAFADERGYRYRTDTAGNIVVCKPAAEGYEDAPIVVLQGHVDMVCEKLPEVDHDFRSDPIPVIREEEWITAAGTSLGADNGIGVAAALAVLDDETLTHGPLECLFTVDEETGLTGAFALENDMLEGRIMLNLDSEEAGSIYVGCAGGGAAMLYLPIAPLPEMIEVEWQAAKITVSGLRGGHSGVDAHEQRANAIKLLGRMLWTLAQTCAVRVVAMEGGSKHNAIPRDASAALLVVEDELDELDAQFTSELEAIRSYYRPIDPAIEMGFETVEDASIDECAVPNCTQSRRLIDLIQALPHGVQAMSYDIEELVETSSNLAIVKMIDDAEEIETVGFDPETTPQMVFLHESVRSSVDTELDAARARIEAVAALVGAAVERGDAYPGWKPDLDSDVLQLTKAVYRDLFDEEPEVKAIHAGLETGIVGEKFPGMDMVSFGPEIQHPHSPDERVEIPTVGDFYSLLLTVLERLAETS